MRNKRILVVAFLLQVCLTLNAQTQQPNTDTLRALYQKEAIWVHFPHYYKNGARFHFSEMKNEFSFSPQGLLEYKLGAKKVNTGLYLTYAAAATTLSSIFVFSKNRNLGWGLLAGGFIINGIGASISLDGRKRIQRAVFIRNQDLMFPPR